MFIFLPFFRKCKQYIMYSSNDRFISEYCILRENFEEKIYATRLQNGKTKFITINEWMRDKKKQNKITNNEANVLSNSHPPYSNRIRTNMKNECKCKKKYFRLIQKQTYKKKATNMNVFLVRLKIKKRTNEREIRFYFLNFFFAWRRRQCFAFVKSCVENNSRHASF